MCSVSSLPYQTVVLPLSHVASVWSALRSSTASRQRQTRTAKKRSHDTTLSSSNEVSFENGVSTELIKDVVHQLGLSELGRSGIEVRMVNSLMCPAVDRTSLNRFLSEPLVSAATFFENKHGFPENQAKRKPVLCRFSSLLQSFPQSQTPLLQHVRGFKTRPDNQAIGVGSRRRVVDDGSLIQKQSMFEKILASNEAKSSKRLRELVTDADLPVDARDKVKIAFAEGYMANEQKKSSGSMWLKVPRYILNVVITAACIWLLIQIILAYSATGGNMKINVLTGERFEVNPEEINVTFDDVKGVDEAKQELTDIVIYLRDPERFTSLGAKLPKGVLLVGPPGVGKSLLARAVAGEAGVPFFYASGSEFDEIFVGTGAKRVRQLFDAAKMRTPCIIFIDEIDTVGAKRTSSQLHPHANQTINQLLSEMDGFQQNEGIIVLGATNRRDNLDKALLRPGRFDVEVRVDLPDLKGRHDILEHYLSKVKVSYDVDVDKLARGTTGSSGADLANMVNQAALKAAMDAVSAVTMDHMEYARDKILMGPAKKTKIPDEDQNKLTAYHEAGHTLVAMYTKDAIPLNKVTIIPRGESLGHTSFIPDKEQYNKTRSQLLAQLDVAMGGRVAEELIFGNDKVTTGASADLVAATETATMMVKIFGMSEKVGLRVFDTERIDTGDATTEMLDSEIRRLLQESYERARTVLKTHQSELKQLAQALLKYETLDVTEVKAIIEGRPVVKNSSSTATANQVRPASVKPSTPSRSPSPSQSTVPV